MQPAQPQQPGPIKAGMPKSRHGKLIFAGFMVMLAGSAIEQINRYKFNRTLAWDALDILWMAIFYLGAMFAVIVAISMLDRIRKTNDPGQAGRQFKYTLLTAALFVAIMAH